MRHLDNLLGKCTCAKLIFANTLIYATGLFLVYGSNSTRKKYHVVAESVAMDRPKETFAPKYSWRIFDNRTLIGTKHLTDFESTHVLYEESVRDKTITTEMYKRVKV